ncbi:MAG: HepT-like ribonuclease domain-containing protein [Vicinamibacteria bacterium]
MLDAAEAIAKFVEGADFETFRQDRKTVDAVVRNLEVIGEAARHVPDSVRERFSEIPWDRCRRYAEHPHPRILRHRL